MKKFFILFFSFLIYNFSFLISSCWAGRPLSTDDAYVTETGKTEFESVITYYKFRNECNYLNLITTTKYGLLPHLETSVEVVFSFWARAGQGDTGLSDLNFKTKYLFNEGARNRPLFGLSFVYLAPTGDCEKNLGGGVHRGTLNFISSYKLNKIFIHKNLGYSFAISGQGNSFWSVALAGEFPLTLKNTGFLELTGCFPINSAEKILNFGLGINQRLAGNVVTDTAITFGLTQAAPKYAITSGWTFSF